jgi:hypothetical protein
MNYIATLLVAILYDVNHLTLSPEITPLISIASGNDTEIFARVQGRILTYQIISVSY